MYKTVLLLSIALFFVSCASATPEPKVLEAKSIKPNDKAFDAEDTYILFALRAEQLKDHKAASTLFETLYEKSEKKEYLYRSLENSLIAKENKKVITKVDDINAQSMDDVKLTRLKVVALFDMNRLDEASVLAVALAHKTQLAKDYLLVSDVYIKRQEFDMALKYLEGGYIKNYNEKILDKLSIVMYVNLGRKKDAIAQLETHIRIHGCSRLICSRLIGFYSDMNNIDGILSTYLKLYNVDKNEEIAKKIIQVYTYKQDYIKLLDFLEESGSDDELLLQLYVTAKNYEKAFPLSQKIYEKNAEIVYLGQSAIYEYEAAKDKNDSKLLKRVIDKLEEVSRTDKNTVYLNYLGYILIDHEVDVQKGMSYIREVLKEKPDSSFYLDSLAWGYYKEGNCKEAKKIMNRVVTLEGGDHEEVLSHVKSIDMCLKMKKGKKSK